MELQEALIILSKELAENPQYYQVMKGHIRTNFINAYANKAINLPEPDFIYCPTSTDVLDMADDAADSIIMTLLNKYYL